MANANDDASTTTTPRMTTEEKFAFDLRGFVVVRGVYDAEQVRKMNAAIDARESEIVERKGRLRLGGEAAAGGGRKKSDKPTNLRTYGIRYAQLFGYALQATRIATKTAILQ